MEHLSTGGRQYFVCNVGIDFPYRFGILLYEMMGFRTPFYEKNRKLMFHGAEI